MQNVFNKYHVPSHAQFILDCDSLLICNEHNLMGACLCATKGKTSGISREVILWQQFVHGTSFNFQNSNCLYRCLILSRNGVFSMAVFSHTSCHQIASFCASFVVSSYWLLLWIRFKLRWRTSLASLRNVSPSSDGDQRPRAQIWRHFGAFAALVCAGVIPMKFETPGPGV